MCTTCVPSMLKTEIVSLNVTKDLKKKGTIYFVSGRINYCCNKSGRMVTQGNQCSKTNQSGKPFLGTDTLPCASKNNEIMHLVDLLFKTPPQSLFIHT